jgi:hypothetical protein
VAIHNGFHNLLDKFNVIKKWGFNEDTDLNVVVKWATVTGRMRVEVRG